MKDVTIVCKGKLQLNKLRLFISVRFILFPFASSAISANFYLLNKFLSFLISIINTVFRFLIN